MQLTVLTWLYCIYCTLFGLLPLLPDSHPTVPAPEPASPPLSSMVSLACRHLRSSHLPTTSPVALLPGSHLPGSRLPGPAPEPAYRGLRQNPPTLCLCLLGRLCLHPGAYICKVALCCAGMAAPSISSVKTDFITTVNLGRSNGQGPILGC